MKEIAGALQMPARVYYYYDQLSNQIGEPSEKHRVEELVLGIRKCIRASVLTSASTPPCPVTLVLPARASSGWTCLPAFFFCLTLGSEDRQIDFSKNFLL